MYLLQLQAQPAPPVGVDSFHYSPHASPYSSMHGYPAPGPPPSLHQPPPLYTQAYAPGPGGYQPLHANPMVQPPPSAVDVDSATVYDVLSRRVSTEPNIFKPEGH